MQAFLCDLCVRDGSVNFDSYSKVLSAKPSSFTCARLGAFPQRWGWIWGLLPITAAGVSTSLAQTHTRSI